VGCSICRRFAKDIFGLSFRARSWLPLHNLYDFRNVMEPGGWPWRRALGDIEPWGSAILRPPPGVSGFGLTASLPPSQTNNQIGIDCEGLTVLLSHL